MCGIEIDLVLASGSNLTCFCAGVKVDFGVVYGPKITWCWHRKWPDFCARNQNWLDFRGSKLTWFQSRDGNWLDFSVGVEIDIFFVWIKIDLVQVLGSKLTWFCAGIKIDFVYVCGPKWLDFSACIEFNLVFVWGSKLLGFCVRAEMTCF